MMHSGEQPRFVPVDQDCRVLNVRRGDFLAVIPLDGFRGEAVYVISVEGRPLPFRCTPEPGGHIRLRSLNPRGGETVLTEAEFGEVLLGQVLATCRVLDRTLLERVRG